MLSRVVSALIMRETDPAQAPLRRGISAIFTGVMIAVVVGAGFGIYGLLTKIGSGKWRVDGAVIVEREDGAAFVYNGDTLTPTLNYASALLLSGKAPPTVFTVSRKALAGVPRALPRGIPGAPDALPDVGRVVGPPWTLCAVPALDEAGKPIVPTRLAVGRAAVGGRDLGEEGLLVRDTRTAEVYLLWHSHRYRISQPDVVVPSLFGNRPPTFAAGTAWLNGVPRGLDIGPIAIPGRGSASAAVPNAKIGDVVVERLSTGDQFFLVLDGGLAPITSLQKDVVVGQFAVAPRERPAAEVNQLPKVDALAPAASDEAEPPDRTPRLTRLDSGAACAETANARTAPRLLVGAAFPDTGPGGLTGARTATGTSLADVVAVPPGGIAVVRAMASPDAEGGAYSIVTDQGVRYPVPSADVLGMLGYSAAQAVDMPAGLLNRVPAGPTLSPSAALAAARPESAGD
jgi:type VII secretion protein EccB